jgi:hypothetical protein
VESHISQKTSEIWGTRVLLTIGISIEAMVSQRLNYSYANASIGSLRAAFSAG